MQASRVIQVNRVPLVIGMEWIPLLGDPSAAASMARQQRASHRVLSGDPPAALGLARGLPRRSAPCWSAADLMGRQHPAGTVARLVDLGDGSWHVLACHEGVALARADRTYPDRAMACEAIESMRPTHPGLRVLDPPAVVSASGAVGLDDLARMTPSAPALQPVRRIGPGLRRVLVLLALGSLGAWRLLPQAAGDPPGEEASARAAWHAALQLALARQPLHGPGGTRALLQGLYRQPVRLAGWTLQSLQCEPQPAGGDWQCLGDYRRTRADADNRGLASAAPGEWRLDFPSLDRARARWSLAVGGAPAQPAQLATAAHLSREWASSLQQVLVAFSRVHLEVPQPLAVVAPRDDRGHERPRPPDLPVIATRVLRVQGPLQSASLLAPHAQFISWRKAVLNFLPNARAGVRTGRLILQLEGVIHERV